MAVQVKELRLKRSDKKLAMAALCAKETDDTPMSEEDIASFNTLKEEVDRLEARISRLTASSADDADEAAPVDKDDDDDDEKSWGGQAVKKSFSIHGKNEMRVPLTRKGEHAGRWIVAQWHVKEHGLKAAQAMVDKVWGDDLVRKTMLTTSQPIIPQSFSTDFISLLQEKSVIRSIGPTVYPMPFGNLTIPRQSLGSVGSWFGEGANITTTAIAFDNLQLSWKKQGALTYCSYELLEYTPLSAASIIAEDLTSRLALLEDRTFLLGPAGTAFTPAGIPGQIAAGNILTNTLVGGAVTFQSVSYDLQAAELQLTANLVRGTFVWIMHPSVRAFLMQLSSSFGVFPFQAELMNDRLNGHRVVTTTQMPTNTGTAGASGTTILLVNPPHMIIGDAARFAISMTTEGSFIDTGSGNQVNSFGQDLVAWKCTNEVDFAISHGVSACMLKTTNWTLGYVANGIDQYIGTPDTAGSTASSAVD